MIKKSFVSISFATSGRIHILELNRSKTKVKNKFMADLPVGLIDDFKVVNHSKLALVLKDVWKKLRIGEKSVGIVVPEFSTYTKLLSVPKLERKETDEAIYWQSQEFLPNDPSNYILDWKILSSTDAENQVLVVAVDKEVLEGYVAAVDQAGLFPLAVETPSLSLVRFASQKPIESLILYLGKTQSLAIVSKGQKIFGSSVTHPDNVSTITQTSKQMLSHYKDIDVKKIYVGGQNLTDEMIDQISKSFDASTEVIDFEINGLTQDEKQKYLIAISMQYKNPSEPADEHTINLLPDDQVKKYQAVKLKLQVWSLTLTATLFIWISFLAVFGTYLFLRQSAQNMKLSQNPNQLLIDEKEILLSEISQINKTNEKVIKLYDEWVYPQHPINLVTSAKIEGITIDNYEFDFESGLVRLRGIARLRGDILEFKRNLEESPYVTNVSIPISSFENDSNLAFDLSFVYEHKE